MRDWSTPICFFKPNILKRNLLKTEFITHTLLFIPITAITTILKEIYNNILFKEICVPQFKIT